MQQITNAMNYKEIYETLNDQQRKAFETAINCALKPNWPDSVVKILVMRQTFEDDLCLNKDQLLLFNSIIKYILENRERVYESIREAMTKEFFDGMDQLMAEQEELKENTNPKED